jgi:hypothetical protein
MEGRQLSGAGQHDDTTEKSSNLEPHSNVWQSAVPTLVLPKGGVALYGIGEKFASNPITCTGSKSVPIATSPGRAGIGTQLSLSYDSGTVNGVFGFGWNLPSSSITRKTDKGPPRYLDADVSDVFILSGAEDLVQALDDNGLIDILESPGSLFSIQRYRPRVKGLFTRIEHSARLNNGIHWRSLSKDNILTLYSKKNLSRIADPEQFARVFSWFICEARDDKGNAILYDNNPKDGVGLDFSQVHERNRGKEDDLRRSANRYLKSIRYGNVEPLLVNGRRPFSADNLIEQASWMFENANWLQAKGKTVGQCLPKTQSVYFHR